MNMVGHGVFSLSEVPSSEKTENFYLLGDIVIYVSFEFF